MLDLVQPHAAVRPAQERLSSIRLEIEIGLRPQEAQQLRQLTVGIGLRDGLGLPHVGVPDHIDQRLRHPMWRQHQIDHAGIDGALGHPGIRRGCRILRDDDAALGFDEAQTRRAVRPGARKNDADRPFLLVLRERTEKDIDRAPLRARLARLARTEQVALELQGLIGRDDVDVVRLDRDLALHLDHRHLGMPAEQLGQVALARRIQVRDHDERHAGVARHGIEQLFQRVQPACRRANADDGKVCHRAPRRLNTGDDDLTRQVARCSVARQFLQLEFRHPAPNYQATFPD